MEDELLQHLEELREIAYLVQDAPRKARRRVLANVRRYGALEADVDALQASSPAAAALLAEIQPCSMSWGI